MHTNYEVKESRHKHSKKGYTVKNSNKSWAAWDLRTLKYKFRTPRYSEWMLTVCVLR